MDPYNRRSDKKIEKRPTWARRRSGKKKRGIPARTHNPLAGILFKARSRS